MFSLVSVWRSPRWPCTRLRPALRPAAHGHAHAHAHVQFNVRSVKDGNWSDPKTWSAERVPAAGDRVLVARGTKVLYDVKSEAVLRLVQIVGTLTFARDRDTQLNVGVLKVQNSDECSESGFACDFAGVNAAGEPQGPRQGPMPTLEVGTLEKPIPAEHTARIRCTIWKAWTRTTPRPWSAARPGWNCTAPAQPHVGQAGRRRGGRRDERDAGRAGDRLASRRRDHRHRLEEVAAARGSYRDGRGSLGTEPRQDRQDRRPRRSRSISRWRPSTTAAASSAAKWRTCRGT